MRLHTDASFEGMETAPAAHILQSSHTVLNDVPLENVVAYIEEVRRMAGMN